METKSILFLNEQAIAALSHDDYRQAISCMRSAIDQTRSLAEKPAPWHSHHRVESSPVLVAPVHLDSLKFVPDSGDVMICQPLSLSLAKINIFTSVSQQDVQLLMTALVFNLGLCIHLQAQSSIHKQTRNLHKAKYVYQWAMEHAATTATTSFANRATRDGAHVVLTAIGNNLASLLASLYQFNELVQVMEWTERQVSQCQGGLNLSFYVFNCMFWRGALTKPAPAA